MLSPPRRLVKNPLSVPTAACPAPALALDFEREQATRRWLDLDMAAAGEVQRTFLPPLEQRWRGVEIAAEYRPAHQVGGDFFDVATRPEGRLTAIVGDVAGKGVSAALVMARVSSEFRRFAAAGLRPRGILEGVNRWLDQQDLCDKFVTAVCVELDLRWGLWIVASAGHPAALLRRTDGTLEELGGVGGPALGLGGVAAWRCEEESEMAEAGDTLLLMTDGLSDGLDLGELAAVACGRTPTLEDFRRDLFARVERGPRRDDATWLGLRLERLGFSAGTC